jgi:membrane protease YdiL (CAAX protease family)
LSNKSNLFPFIFITLAWTWAAGFIPLLIGIADTPKGDLLFKLMAGPAPSAIAVIIVLITYTKPQKKDYFKRAFDFRLMGFKWPLLTMAFFAIGCGTTILASAIFFGGAIPEFGGIRTLSGQPYMIFFFLFLAVMSGPFNEEFGWRGFALDRLIVRYGFWPGSVILGFIWGIWHLPWYFYPGNGQYIAWRASPIHGIMFVAMSITLSCIVSIVYLKTNRSIMAGAFVHMISNFFTGSMLIYPYDDTYFITLMYVMTALEGLVVLCFMKNSGFQNEKKALEQFTPA